MNNLQIFKNRLEKDSYFSLSLDNRVIEDTLGTRFGKYFSQSYRTQRAKELAKSINKILSSEERQAPRVNDKLLAVQIARIFRKTLVPQCSKGVRSFEKLEREELACRLGISVQCLYYDINKGFFEFAKRICLSTYLAAMNHTLKVENGEIYIMKGGKYHRWLDVRPFAEESLAHASSHFKKESWRPMYYDETGLVYIDTYDKKLRPFTHVEPSNTCRFRLSVNTTYKFGHTWCEVIDKEGTLHSFSRYRKPDREISCEIYQAESACPDSASYWQDYACDGRLEVAISDKVHRELLDTYLEIAQSKHHAFQNLLHNCTTLGIHLLQKAAGEKVKLPECKVTAWRIYTPFLYRALKSLSPLMPEKMRRAASQVFNVIGNLICWNAGGFMYDPVFKNADGSWVPDLLDPSRTLRPQFLSYKDLFNPSKLDMTPPIALKENIIDAALKWREEEKAKLPCDDPRRAQIEYQLPPKWSLQT